MAEVKLSVSGQAQLKALAGRLKEAGETGLRKETSKGLKKIAKPAVQKVQGAVRTLDVKGTRGGGKKARRLHKTKAKGKMRWRLRETIAKATVAEIKMGGTPRVTIRTRSRHLPPDQRKLPKYLDSEKGWRHPVWGNKDVWVDQHGGPWFSETLKKEIPAVRREMIAALDRVADKIEGHP